MAFNTVLTASTAQEHSVRLRSMVDDPSFAYEHIPKKFGLTKQRIAKLVEELGINGRQRRHERSLGRGPYVEKKEYPPDVRAVIEEIRRRGFRVMPYNALQPYRQNVVRKSQNWWS
ncbi:MAG TPA: hypothetical protein VGW77_35475 [Candidatus Binatia bacterium]|jgi:hypothetical protein|nr:hypothetical protein [Candidatus Binatia bacterium]